MLIGDNFGNLDISTGYIVGIGVALFIEMRKCNNHQLKISHEFGVKRISQSLFIEIEYSMIFIEPTDLLWDQNADR